MTNNQPEFHAGIEKFIQQLQETAEKTVNQLGEKAVEVAQNTTAFKNTLKESTHFTPNGLSGEVTDDRFYAYWLEYGNDPGGGRIYPVHAKALHFFINGEEIFAKSVKAHGPYHFVENGRNIAESMLEDIFNSNLQGTT